MKLETVIGLEIHVQLKTRSKMFCGCSNAGENEDPNTTICPVCLGHPGTLPAPNKQAIEWAAKTALALSCSIPKHSKFDRKHYFYPDLPKGYQISQYDEPIGMKGSISLVAGGEERTIRIHRLHLEEDAAKLLHNEKGDSFVDYNRGGTPLMEIVTEADLRSPEEAGAFLRELRLMMRYLKVSDADMEKGHLRCDANVSLRPEGSEELFPKTEVKNINSFKAVERALSYEVKRQSKIWEETGEAPTKQGTRGWDEDAAKTLEQRTKEGSADYRYFPDPDIPELDFDKDWVDRIKSEIPELPADLRKRFMDEYGFNTADAKTFASDSALAHYAEEVISELKVWLTSKDPEASAEEIWERDKKKLAKLVSSWLLSKLLGALNASGGSISNIKITAENMAELMTMVHESRVNSANAQLILGEMLKTGSDPSDILESKDLGAMEDDGSLEGIIADIVKNSPKQAEEYQSGKEVVFQYFVGQVMKETRGKADPVLVSKMLKKALAE
ncbi:glutaminyl-tRNA synthase (glutamine-hydrolyzing) subunit B [bacterium CG10_46_32]|nr:MAG: glutaminyl-tRNA synthase (glutamine-hydrolyzing) subunit B [bacterium CG10_46_32]PIR55691.1 MAG: Asp-tRNA(Asn)/Glu-tRNA(Gln) amidotransferase subunit GatB [Parcubacteria group bacterium CG10_big_fil_rev_8_21_14_0_10_46_32]